MDCPSFMYRLLDHDCPRRRGTSLPHQRLCEGLWWHCRYVLKTDNIGVHVSWSGFEVREACPQLWGICSPYLMARGCFCPNTLGEVFRSCFWPGPWPTDCFVLALKMLSKLGSVMRYISNISIYVGMAVESSVSICVVWCSKTGIHVTYESVDRV